MEMEGLPSIALTPAAVEEYLHAAAGAAGSANLFNMRYVKNPNAAARNPAPPAAQAPRLLGEPFTVEVWM